MAKKLRFPLLLVLTALTVLWVLAPTPAFAAIQPGTCPNGVGHYTSIQPVYGNAKPKIYGCNFQVSSIYCQVATQEVDWDCTQTNNTIHPTNFTYWSPNFCGCPTVHVCCN